MTIILNTKTNKIGLQILVYTYSRTHVRITTGAMTTGISLGGCKQNFVPF